MNESQESSQSSRLQPPPADDATVISGGDSASVRSGSSALRAPALPPSRTASTEIGRILAGTMLGPYRLDEFIGGGGMGAVFRALDTTLDRIVAVKVLARHDSEDEETLRRFRNEAQSAARLDHENIGRVHAVGSEGDWHFIVFEFIEGTNIRDLVREQGAFDPARVIDIAIQVADALEHASQREIVHRDIKPSNIVITPAGRARIVDMGLARLHQMAGDADLTVSGVTLGTFDYISPEQARDPRVADVRSDLYSLGCTMFYMFTGRPPFAEGTMVQKLLQHQQAEPPAVDELRPEVPRRLAAIVARLMEKNPLDRYQRPAVLAADLLACAEAEALQLAHARSLPLPMPIERPVSAPLPWLVPTLLLAALVAGLWLRSMADRRRIEPIGRVAPTSSSADPGVASAAAEPAARMVTSGAGLVAALAAIEDGGVVEIDHDGGLEVASLTVGGRRVTIQSAAGRQPVLRVRPAIDGSGVRLEGGELTLRGLALHLEPDAAAVDAAPSERSLFRVAGGRLVCEDVVLRMPGDPRRRTVEAGVAAFVRVAGPVSPGVAVLLTGTRAAGDADLLAVAVTGGGRVEFRWLGGAIVTPRRLLSLEGSQTVTMVDCVLENLVAACGAGVAACLDSPASPLPVRLSSTASACRFVVTDPSRPFVEQAGIGSPQDYADALVWQDHQGRYEGGAVFRRIDGAAERIDLPFGDATLPLLHTAVTGQAPQPLEWAGWKN